MKREAIALYVNSFEICDSASKMIVSQVNGRDAVERTIVSVVPEFSAEYAEYIDKVHRLCVSIGAEMNIICSNKPKRALKRYIKDNHIKELITDDISLACDINNRMTDVSVRVIPSDCTKIYGVLPDKLLYSMSFKA